MLNPINIADFSYELPEERIASFPLEKRDDAKLLVYIKGEIAHSQFFKLHNFLSKDTLLVFNNTKVVPARLYFQRETGALIEVFLLQPESPKLVSQAMQSTESCIWKCLIGNKKRWKSEDLTQEILIGEILVTLTAQLLDVENNYIQFSWDNDGLHFLDIMQYFGEIPLPPYIKRKANEADQIQYQTVYSKPEGAVAAPTAGLHFTEEVFKQLDKKGIQKEFITLHVSGGTFQSIKVENALEHQMHAEQIIFSQEAIEQLIETHQHIVAVGTTSMRSLESLYWFGVKLLHKDYVMDKDLPIAFFIEKLYPYQFALKELPTIETALKAVLGLMQAHHLKEIVGETEIFIFPGYHFQMCKGLITNYHLPNTTLILLVAAFVGEDWRKIYQEALQNDYRFLSYGDSSLLIP